MDGRGIGRGEGKFIGRRAQASELSLYLHSGRGGILRTHHAPRTTRAYPYDQPNPPEDEDCELSTPYPTQRRAETH